MASGTGGRHPAVRTVSDPPHATGRWDLDALRAGAGVSLVFAVPLTVIAAIIGTGSSGVNAVFFFGAILGFVLGAGCAAWMQERGTPISHGMVAAAGIYLAVQAVLVATRLITGRDVNWFGVFFTLSLVLVAGAFGGVLGQRLQDKGFVPSTRRRDDLPPGES